MRGRFLLAGICVLIQGSSSVIAAPPAVPQALVPAQFVPKTDGVGGQWTMDSNYVRHQPTSLRVGLLQFNGNGFNTNNQMMTADGTEYVINGTLDSLSVVRSMKFDSSSNTIRIIDSFTNPQATAAAGNVQLMLMLRSNGTQAITSSGEPVGNFGNKDVGLMAPAQRSSSPVRVPNSQSLLYYVADARAKLKPSLHLENGSQTISVNYNLAVPSGQTVSVIHGCALRNLTGSEDAEARRRLFAPFLSNKWVADVTPEVRKRFVNRGGGGGTWFEGKKSDELLADVQQLAEASGVEVAANSVLSIDEETQLSGNVRGESINVNTTFGKITIPLTEIAAISGGANVGRLMRVFLRNGEILSGEFVGQLIFEDAAGLEVPLSAARMLDLFLPEGTKLPSVATATIFLETRDGNRVIINPDMKFTAATAWGRLELSAANVSVLYPIDEPQPIHQVVFKDHSRLSVILKGTDFTAASPRFGALKVATGDIVKLVTLSPSMPENAETAEDVSPEQIWNLTGDNSVVGKLASNPLKVFSEGAETTIDMEQVRSIESSGGDDGEFSVELVGGNRIVAKPADPVWRIKSSNRTWTIPASHLVSYQGRSESSEVNSAAVPEDNRTSLPARPTRPSFAPPAPAAEDPFERLRPIPLPQ